MKKPWSISTTVRNPERLRGFLGILKLLEGRPFDAAAQIDFQILLIRHKLYKPTILSKEQCRYFSDIEREMPIVTARAIFDSQNYEDPAMRGRTSVAPLKKMGLCNIKDRVRVTPLGDYLLSEDYDLGRLFFIHFLKWHLPNPISRDFSKKDGFNIKPFIGTLRLINEVNRLWERRGRDPVGVNKDEFSLFAPTLIDYRHIAEQAEKLIEYRVGCRSQANDESGQKFSRAFKREFAKNFLHTNDDSEAEKLLKNLVDYGDNAIRYFRLTRYLHIRGNGFYVDLEPRRSIELKRLLATDNAAPLEFESAEDYVEYLADLNQPELPWGGESELRRIAVALADSAREYAGRLESDSDEMPTFAFKGIERMGADELKVYIESLRVYRQRLSRLEAHIKSRDSSRIIGYIDALKNIHASRLKKSIELERLLTLSLIALDDAHDIKPNYPVGDDNEPTFTAPANKPDIECFYERFNSVCEVTMLKSRDQWYNEGQPVMRHVRKFEQAHPGKQVYCLFVAPRLHPDTIETFWVAVKHGYRGATQKIIPLSIAQFTRILECLVETNARGGMIKHDDLMDLYDRILNIANSAVDSDAWIEKIPQAISEWTSAVLAEWRS